MNTQNLCNSEKASHTRTPMNTQNLGDLVIPPSTNNSLQDTNSSSTQAPTTRLDSLTTLESDVNSKTFMKNTVVVSNKRIFGKYWGDEIDDVVYPVDTNTQGTIAQDNSFIRLCPGPIRESSTKKLFHRFEGYNTFYKGGSTFVSFLYENIVWKCQRAS